MNILSGIDQSVKYCSVNNVYSIMLISTLKT